MQKVSKRYKESMRSPIRERSYIMISFGLINLEAQANAKVRKGNFSPFSKYSNVFQGTTPINDCATLEKDFTPVDGSMVFAPTSQLTEGSVLNSGIISEKLVSDEPFELQ